MKSAHEFNEIRGHLFEYLVGQEWAKLSHLERFYLESVGEVALERLKRDQEALRENDFLLGPQLQGLAKATVQALSQRWTQIDRINLLGLTNTETKGAADLTVGFQDQRWGLSLKLAKWGNTIHARNAGMRSFLAKYFSHPEAPMLQTKLNQKLDILNDEFKFLLNENEIQINALPSTMVGTERGPLLEYYYKQIKLVKEGIDILLSVDRKKFQEGLILLSGFDTTVNDQVICFHQGDHTFHSLKMKSRTEIEEVWKDFQLKDIKEPVSSFDVEGQGGTLKIRVKPMMGLQERSYKVNCSLRYDF
jgi:hypothetical protein